jgi:hypothetical protein
MRTLLSKKDERNEERLRPIELVVLLVPNANVFIHVSG